MKGKVCVVTGANSGIGLVTALELAKLGATTVLICRNVDKGRVAVEDIKSSSSNGDVHLIIADLSSMAEVRRAANEFNAQFDRLDVLVNNAGAIQGSHTTSADGYEMTVALNHLGYFVLTHYLLKALKAGAPSRIINVASGAHRRGSGVINFDDPFTKKDYDAWSAYGQSKLMNIMFTYELARRLEGFGIDANAMHPGVVRTNFGRGGTKLFQLGFGMATPFLLSPEQGADTMVYMATEPDLQGVTGRYFIKREDTRSSDYSYNREDQRKLWELSLTWSGIKDYFQDIDN